MEKRNFAKSANIIALIICLLANIPAMGQDVVAATKPMVLAAELEQEKMDMRIWYPALIDEKGRQPDFTVTSHVDQEVDREIVISREWGSDPVKKPSVVKVQKWRTSRWREYQTITVDHLKEYKEKPVKICKFGGRLDTQEKATGFFYTKKVNGAWTLVDPCGHHYISMSVNSISPNDRNPDSKAAFKEKFGNKKNWAVKTAALLKENLHLNSLGCWSSWELFKEAGTPVPYFRRWNVMARYAQERNLTYKKYGHTGFVNNVIPVFDPEFAVFCDKLFQNMKETKDDPYLIGHFSDNELPLKEKDIIKRHLECGDKSSSAQRAKSWLKERGKTVDDITEEDDREFCKLVLSTYYRIVSEKMKKYDPNHLYVGTRVHGGVLKASVTYEACGPYVDVVSMNYYHRWSPEQDLLDERAKLSGKPLLITEWYAKGVDGGLPLTAGAGFAVHTQKERGMFYENYTMGLLKNKNVLGWHWHRYIDDGPKHRKENASNKGFLDTQFNEWEDLTNSVQRINKQVYSLRDYLLPLKSDNFPDKPRLAK